MNNQINRLIILQEERLPNLEIVGGRTGAGKTFYLKHKMLEGMYNSKLPATLKG